MFDVCRDFGAELACPWASPPVSVDHQPTAGRALAQSQTHTLRQGKAAGEENSSGALVGDIGTWLRRLPFARLRRV